MYKFERTKKVVIAMFSLSVISFILTFIGFGGGGEELLRYGFMNTPGPTILMFASAGVFIISLLTGIGFNALSKDIAAELRYIDEELRNGRK